MNMKRVMTLYRVSTTKQVDVVKDDIPMQKIACRNFIEEKKWQLVGEKEEKGVSGFKVSAAKRDAIQELKEAAERKEFDILLVFMFDRLGRIDSETPFIVEWFITHGIEVWSVNEGEQKMEQHIDKLMNYLRFWQASGESEKTSIRVKTRHTQMTLEGIYTGGVVPYGYQLVHNGRLNKKGQEMRDLAIHPEEADIVRFIFTKVVHEGYGSYRLASILNNRGLKTHNGSEFNSSFILRILKNKIYIGFMERGGNCSERIDALVIIPDELFYQAQDYVKQRDGKNEEKRKIALTNRSQSLLSGIVYCYHCKTRLTTSRYRENYVRADGTTYHAEHGRYVCYHRSRRLNDCDGATTYNADKIDEAVIEIMRQMFSSIAGCPQEDKVEAAYKKAIAANHDLQTKLKADIEKNKKQLDNLRAEIVKALSGESMFTSDDLSDALKDLRAKIERDEQRLSELKAEDMEKKTLSDSIIPAYRRFKTWAVQFEESSFEAKKVIAQQLFERVEIEAGYKIHCTLNLTYQQFCEEWIKIEKKLPEAS